MPSSSSSVGFAIVLLVGVFSATARADEPNLPPLPPPSTDSQSPTEAPASPPVVSTPVASALTAGAPCSESANGCSAESDASPKRGAWYGYQTLIVDSLAVGFGFSATNLGSSGVGLSAGTNLLGAPLVHLAHGRPGMFAASLGSRVVSPALGGVTGYAIGAGLGGCGGGNYCVAPMIGAAAGFLSGLLAASALDAALFAREAKPEEPKPWNGKPTIAPTASAGPTGASLGVGGLF